MIMKLITQKLNSIHKAGHEKQEYFIKLHYYTILCILTFNYFLQMYCMPQFFHVLLVICNI
jgi:hypothetical protein